MACEILTNVARQVLAEFVNRGEVEPSSKEEMAGRVEGYSNWLESYVASLRGSWQVGEELASSGFFRVEATQAR